MRHQLQGLLGARLDREIQNEHENVRTFVFYFYFIYFMSENGTKKIAGLDLQHITLLSRVV